MVEYDPNKPHVFLSGANIENAKSVAMGAAATNGWKIADSSGNRLLLRRTLETAPDPRVIGAQVPGSKPPLVQVEAGFFPRPNGVEVTVGADLITNRGTEEEHARDFTQADRKNLMHSLASLEKAWAATAPQVANAMPPLQAPGNLGAPPTAEESKEIAQTEGSGQWGPTNWGDEPAPASGPPAQPSTAPAPAPEATAGAPRAQDASSPPTAVAGAGEDRSQPGSIVVLNESADTGLWAYYAEHYARAHGCTPTGKGSVLVEQTPEYEVHRVECRGGRKLLLRCNAGSCEETR
jgi:hypothetical protein